MPDEPTPTPTPAAAEPATPAAPAATTPAVTPAATPAEPAATPAAEPKDGEQWDHERGMATIQKLRQELKDAKKTGGRVAELEQQLQALEDEKLTEQQRVEKERDTLLEQQKSWEREKRDTTLRLAVYGLQAELGIADTDLAIAALDASQVEYDQTTGQPTNLSELLTDLLEKKPILKATDGTRRAPAADGKAGAQQKPPPDLTAEEIEFANQHGIALDRYAAMKGVTSADEYLELRKREQAAQTT